MEFHIQRDPGDEKKTRNRLAQRKHRERKFVLLRSLTICRLCSWGP